MQPVRNALVAFVFITIFSTLSVAAPLCKNIFGVSFQVAKEIETENGFLLMSLLTTKDGRLMSLVPPESRGEMLQRFGKETENILWKDATSEQRQAAVELVAPTVNFARDRAVPGLQAPQKIIFTPRESFTFLGQNFIAGQKAELDLTGFWLPLVEYAGGRFVKDASALEFHFRGEDPAKLDDSVRLLFSEVLPFASTNVRDSHLKDPVSDHVHVVAVKPMDFVERLKSQGISEKGISRALAAYHTLVELDMALTGRPVGFHGFIEISNTGNNPPLMSFLQKNRIGELVKFYEAVVQGKNLDINKYSEVGTALKKNNAGARWGNAYSDQNLWGIELRFPGFSYSRYYKNLAKGVKETLDNQDFRISDARIQAMEKLSDKEFESKIWFSNSAEENVANIVNPNLKELASQALNTLGGDKAFLSSWDSRKDLSHNIIAFYDWASNPLFASRPANQAMIMKAQTTLLEKAIVQRRINGKDLDQFMQDSGLRDFLNYVVERKPQ